MNRKSRCRQPFPYDRRFRKINWTKRNEIRCRTPLVGLCTFLCGDRRRTERVCELLLAVVHRLLLWGNSEQDALDLLQDRTVELTGRRDGRQLAEEADGASEEGFEAFLVDEFAQVVCAPCRGEDKHVAELSTRLLVKGVHFNQSIISETHA
jgi:hypothetical protein